MFKSKRYRIYYFSHNLLTCVDITPLSCSANFGAPSLYFLYGIMLYIQDILCYAVSVLTSNEDGVVILALLKETEKFTFLIQNGPKQ
jgi:hypothetical protein